MQGVDQDAGIVLADGAHNLGGCRQVARIGPVRKLKADEDAKRPGEVAEARKSCRGPLAIRVGQLGNDQTGTELGRGLQHRNEALGLQCRVHAEQLDVEHLEPGGMQPCLGFLHQEPVVRQIVQRLVGRHPRQAQADVSITGARRHIDHLRRGQRQHRQVRERVDVYHGLFPMFALRPRLLLVLLPTCPC